MSSYTQEMYAEFVKRKETFAEIYNQDTNAGIEHLTGLNEKSAAWRYSKIHGAVELMGGWANCSYWIINHASNYFRTCEKLVLLTQKYGRNLPKEMRQDFNEELERILKDLK